MDKFDALIAFNRNTSAPKQLVFKVFMFDFSCPTHGDGEYGSRRTATLPRHHHEAQPELLRTARLTTTRTSSKSFEENKSLRKTTRRAARRALSRTLCRSIGGFESSSTACHQRSERERRCPHKCQDRRRLRHRMPGRARCGASCPKGQGWAGRTRAGVRREAPQAFGAAMGVRQ